MSKLSAGSSRSKPIGGARNNKTKPVGATQAPRHKLNRQNARRSLPIVHAVLLQEVKRRTAAVFDSMSSFADELSSGSKSDIAGFNGKIRECLGEIEEISERYKDFDLDLDLDVNKNQSKSGSKEIAEIQGGLYKIQEALDGVWGFLKSVLGEGAEEFSEPEEKFKIDIGKYLKKIPEKSSLPGRDEMNMPAMSDVAREVHLNWRFSKKISKYSILNDLQYAIGVLEKLPMLNDARNEERANLKGSLSRLKELRDGIRSINYQTHEDQFVKLYAEAYSIFRAMDPHAEKIVATTKEAVQPVEADAKSPTLRNSGVEDGKLANTRKKGKKELAEKIKKPGSKFSKLRILGRRVSKIAVNAFGERSAESRKGRKEDFHVAEVKKTKGDSQASPVEQVRLNLAGISMNLFEWVGKNIEFWSDNSRMNGHEDFLNKVRALFDKINRYRLEIIRIKDSNSFDKLGDDLMAQVDSMVNWAKEVEGEAEEMKNSVENSDLRNHGEEAWRQHLENFVQLLQKVYDGAYKLDSAIPIPPLSERNG